MRREADVRRVLACRAAGRRRVRTGEQLFILRTYARKGYEDISSSSSPAEFIGVATLTTMSVSVVLTGSLEGQAYTTVDRLLVATKSPHNSHLTSLT